jgi:hypothetical protein
VPRAPEEMLPIRTRRAVARVDVDDLGDAEHPARVPAMGKGGQRRRVERAGAARGPAEARERQRQPEPLRPPPPLPEARDDRHVIARDAGRRDEVVPRRDDVAELPAVVRCRVGDDAQGPQHAGVLRMRERHDEPLHRRATDSARAGSYGPPLRMRTA